MTQQDETDRAVQHALQVRRIQNHIKEQVEKVKMDAFSAREELIQRRAEKIEQVRQKLNQTTMSIVTKHETIKARLNQESVFREASIRVNRGLEALEKFIQVLRDTEMEDEMLKKAIRDPIVSSSIKSEARKIITSEFFRSVQRQLVMQTEFINIAAHELRNPIMPILVNVELLAERLGGDNEGIILISAEITDEHALVSVEDSGPGIDPQMMPILFSKFATKSDKGTGLGLYISREIIEGHGGAIWAENADSGNRGATFSFRIPIQYK